MLTNNYGMDLMVPSQANKDVVFNEAVVKMDAFCNIAINSFVPKVPSEPIPGAMHILGEGDHAMSICYCPSIAAGWKIQKPKKGMIFFVSHENKHFYFEGAKWVPVNVESTGIASSSGLSGDAVELIQPKTTGISGHFAIPDRISKLWLYLSGDVKIDLGSATTNIVTMIIKQNYQKASKLLFGGNILWKDKKPFEVSTKLNAMDMIRFHKISETDHWIPEIVGQGFEY